MELSNFLNPETSRNTTTTQNTFDYMCELKEITRNLFYKPSSHFNMMLLSMGKNLLLKKKLQEI